MDDSRIDPGIVGDESSRVSSHHRVAASSQDGVRRKLKADPSRHAPAGKIDARPGPVVELDEFIIGHARDR